MSKKLILGVFIGFLLFASLFSTARAVFVQDAGTNPAAGESFWAKFSQSVNAPGTDVISWTGWSVQSILAHGVALIGGYPDASGQIPISSINSSLIGGMAQMINTTYQQPISSKEYLAYLSRNLNLATPAYAQGQGWTFLRPVLDVWIIMRNLCYVFFIIIFVAIGFMIMFRAKLDPQTAISIQSALPKIVIYLLLVTFSYAIAGFVIDLAYLLNELIWQAILSKSPIYPIIAAVSGATINGLRTVNVDIVISIFWKAMTSLSLDLLSLAFSAIFSVIIVTTAFRLFLAMLTKYVTLIISTILGPFILLFGALGGGGSIGMWLKTLVSAALAFPATFAVLNLAIYLAYVNQPYLPISPFTLDMFQTGTMGATLGPARLIGLGIFLMSPKVPEVIDGLFKAEGPAAIAGAISPELQSGLRRLPFIGALAG